MELKTKNKNEFKINKKQQRELIAERIWLEYEKSGYTIKQQELADKFGCSTATVSKALTEKINIKNIMTKPVRIQLSRKKGFDLQEYSYSLNGLPAVVVSRPSKFGNPFVLMGDMIYIDAGYRRKIFSKLVYLCMGDAEKCVRLYECVVTGIMQEGDYDIPLYNLPDLEHWTNHFKKLDLAELKGRNLACWCPTDFKYCHASILLKLAN